MRVNSDDGRIVGHKILPTEGFHEPLLHLMLVRSAVAHSSPDLLKRRRCYCIDCVARSIVGLDLLIGPGCFEQRHQIARTQNIFPQPADQLQRAAIYK